MKPKIYVETSVVSYLVSRTSSDVRVAANQVITIEWWDERRPTFDLFISEFVLTEAALGDPSASKLRLDAIKGISQLEVTEEARRLGDALMTEGPIPESAEIDAYHIAIATVNGMDYLLTWNCTHIANAAMRSDIETVCRNYGYEPPIICTPQELMEA